MKTTVLPANAQWAEIQGGKPLLIGNEPSTLFNVVHIYPVESVDLTNSFDSDRARTIGHYGSIIETPIVQLHGSIKKPSGLLVGTRLEEVTVPATMLINAHGKPCSTRSGLSLKNAYRNIYNQKEWAEFLNEKTKADWDLWDVTLQDNALKLTLKGLLKAFL
jgi:hypothetical protein